ncbi:MAG: hypothetical protein ACI4KL_01805 [Lentihominibacter sp.]
MWMRKWWPSQRRGVFCDEKTVVERMICACGPSKLLPIHTESPEAFKSICSEEQLILPDDGEEIDLRYINRNILAFGLTLDQLMKLKKHFPGCNVIDTTECFEDLIAVQAVAAVINPAALNPNQYAVISEVFRDEDEMCIVFTDEVENYPEYSFYFEDSP